MNADELPLGVPPEEAIAFFQRKDIAVGFDWTTFYQHQHATRFTSAGVTSLDALEAMRQVVDRAISEQLTPRQFTAELEQRLQPLGWWRPREVVDPVSGRAKTVNIAAPWRWRVIFDTNMRAAAAAQQWQALVERQTALRQAHRRRTGSAKGQPDLYLVYDAVNDDRTRPEHAAMDGITLPLDHPFWRTHFPPNGWYCRCTVHGYSRDDLDRRGLRITSDKGVAPFLVPIKGGATRRLPDGRRIRIDAHPNVDPGFDYNVGVASLDAPAQKLATGLQGRARGDQQAAIARVLASDDFKQSLERPALNWVVSAAPDAPWVPDAFRPKVPFVQFSAEDVAKIADKHLGSSLRIEDFALLPQLIDSAELAVLDNGDLKLYAAGPAGRFFEIVLRRTTGQAVYIKSFRLTDGRSASRFVLSEDYRRSRNATILNLSVALAAILQAAGP